MLAGMNQERFDALLPVHGSQQGSNLNQVGSCAYDVDDFHLNCRLSYQRKNTLPCMAKGSERRYASLRPTAPNCLPPLDPLAKAKRNGLESIHPCCRI